MPGRSLGEFGFAKRSVVAVFDFVADLVEGGGVAEGHLPGDRVDRGLFPLAHLRLLRPQEQLVFLREGLAQTALRIGHSLLGLLGIDRALLRESPGVLKVLLGRNQLRRQTLGGALPLGGFVHIAGVPGVIGHLYRLTDLALQLFHLFFLDRDGIAGALGIADHGCSLFFDLRVLLACGLHRLVHEHLGIGVVVNGLIERGLEIVPAFGKWVRHRLPYRFASRKLHPENNSGSATSLTAATEPGRQTDRANRTSCA